MLRLHLVEGMSLKAIASARGVHRVTVARWVWNAGEILLEGLRRHFSERGRVYGFGAALGDQVGELLAETGLEDGNGLVAHGVRRGGGMKEGGCRIKHAR